MTTTLTLDSQSLALDLYHLLREIDPARWKDDLARPAAARLAEIRQRIAALLPSLSAELSPALAALREKLAALYALIERATPAEGAAHLREAWNELRLALLPAYEELAASLKALDVHVPSLRPTNYSRNALHVASGLGVVLLVQHLLTEGTMVLVAAAAAIFAWTLEISRRWVPGVNALCMRVLGRFAHPHEAWRINSSTWFTTALLALAILGDRQLASLAVVTLALADPAAAVVGRKFGRTRLVNGRSLEGTLAFLVVGVLAGVALLRLYYPGLDLLPALAVAAAAAVPAALAELFARKIDDNLAIPLSAAAGAWLALLAL